MSFALCTLRSRWSAGTLSRREPASKARLRARRGNKRSTPHSTTSIHPLKDLPALNGPQSAWVRRSRSALRQPVDRLFIMVLATGGRHQSRPAESHDRFEHRNAARRVVAANEEMDSDLSELDDPSEGSMQCSTVCCGMFGPPQTVPLIVFMAIQILCHIGERPRAFVVPPRTRAHLLAATSWPAPAH